MADETTKSPHDSWWDSLGDDVKGAVHGVVHGLTVNPIKGNEAMNQREDKDIGNVASGLNNAINEIPLVQKINNAIGGGGGNGNAKPTKKKAAKSSTPASNGLNVGNGGSYDPLALQNLATSVVAPYLKSVDPMVQQSNASVASNMQTALAGVPAQFQGQQAAQNAAINAINQGVYNSAQTSVYAGAQYDNLIQQLADASANAKLYEGEAEKAVAYGQADPLLSTSGGSSSQQATNQATINQAISAAVNGASSGATINTTTPTTTTPTTNQAAGVNPTTGATPAQSTAALQAIFQGSGLANPVTQS